MRRLPLLVTLALVLFPPMPAIAQLVGADVQGNVFEIDIGDGSGTLIGNLTLNPALFPNEDLLGYNEIVYDPVSGRAWAQQRDGNFQIQEFNIETGVEVGNPVANQASWHALEFIGGTLYGVGFAGPFDGVVLATMNPETGAFNIIGDTGVDDPQGPGISRVITGIAWDGATQTLYGISNGGGSMDPQPGPGSILYTINISTGLATEVGMTGMSAGSLSFGPDGQLYAGGVAGDRGDLFRINTATGAGVLVGVTGFGTGEENGLGGLTLVGGITPGAGGAAVAIPVLNAAGVFLLVALTVLIAAPTIRRRAG